MNTMTTAQAWARAKELHDQGTENWRIGKILASEGYRSFRTGKPLSPAGVYAMIENQKKGKIAKDRPMRKFAHVAAAANARTPRPAKPKSDTIYFEQLAGKPATTIWDIAKLIDEANVFTQSTKKAILDLIVREAAGL